MDLEARIRRMVEYLDEEAVASALQVPVEVVRGVLRGEAVLKEAGASGEVVRIQTVAHRQRVVAVWRAKGGVGATALAAHLARDLGERMRTLLADCDFDPMGSDLPHYLGVEADFPGPWDPEALGELALDSGWGFDVLLPPFGAGPEALVPDLVRGVMAAARRDYDAVVLDLPSRVSPGVWEAARSATTVVVVLGAVRREAMRARWRLERCGGKELYAVVSGCATDAEALREMVGVRAVVAIPYDPELDRALEEGRLLPGDSVFGRGVGELRRLVYGEPVPKAAGRAVFGWWARKRSRS